MELLENRRDYWGVENGLHHRLDVSAMEDKSRVRLRNNALVLALMRRAAVSIAAAWIKGQRNPRQANLPGFFEAAGPRIVYLLTEEPGAATASGPSH